ncbi:hypothetical protein EMIHUDRAFT_223387 [Emiliania huxleyi CCMP1516]|uniref:Aminoacyl-tRNA synthetase class Ia domain-containing protein n=2 Tax=Emiliania huxleyi TaxID=2903 RepID=A0A0D3KVP8_EMIH1|nr:hypothetical protein EMIHUDRAFT_223387 [Emiliania huxleyi CCMP1516]EOD39833.1 hypothetical protein EMIHUDRAFT_223387 [Emiliania huxleyi CCMP1516]|eukprot:XP_005792262.1 hypothetical protein EMIHUDRAFT_223387 [Emiliania huxleyi CCMP1516]
MRSELQSGKPELQPGDSPPNLNASPLPHGARLVVAASLVDALSEALGTPLVVAATLPGAALIGRHCAHPLSARPVPVLHAEHVTDDAGTGLVHTAPGHGPEDFAVGVAHGLAAACPVDEKGCFTAATEEAAGFAGESVLDDGNEAVLTALREGGSLLAAARHEHRYPYDWRSKTPVIFRTTPQWFVRLGDLRGEALAALHAAFVRGRTEWCLSRQRSWGVPLPAFYHVETGEALLTEERETVEHVASLVSTHGCDCGVFVDGGVFVDTNEVSMRQSTCVRSDCWWRLSEAELLPPRIIWIVVPSCSVVLILIELANEREQGDLAKMMAAPIDRSGAKAIQITVKHVKPRHEKNFTRLSPKGHGTGAHWH